MPVESLLIGVPTPILQNVVYAIPPRRLLLFTDAAGATFFQSNTYEFTANVALTLVNGQVEVGGGFIRCTSVSPGNVMLKPI